MNSPPPHIFKAYDIRGIHPVDLDAETARRVGRAFVDYLRARRIAVGRDCRASSPELAEAFVRGARAEGCDVVDLGLVGTDMLYFEVARSGLDGGAIVTASHNPKEWNGIKMVRRGAAPLSGEAGLDAIANALLGGRFTDDPARTGALTQRSIGDDYARHCLGFVDAATLPRLKVVLDPGNGMGAVGAASIFPRLPLELVRMYFDLDGSFPNHPPDPLDPKNLRDVAARVVAEHADLGIAWDGDADRCFLVDDTGAVVPGDFLTALLGEAFCRREAGARVIYDVRASRAVRDRVQAAGGTALVNRVGHAFIKQRMRDEDAIFGGEVSGHFYFRDNWYADNGMVPALLALELVGRSGGTLSELLAPLRARYHVSGEINSKVDDVERTLARLREAHRDAAITTLDGLSVDYDDWHFNVRPSNTEPLLRLNLEASTHAEMVARRDEVLERIRA